MTHEYVIALYGRVETLRLGPNDAASTAVAWAADRVLAVGSDDMVRSISRGDSTFLDLGGCVVTALPDDLARADALVREATMAGEPGLDLSALLSEASLLAPGPALEPGSPADLALWGVHVGPGDSPPAQGFHLVAVVRSGAFTDGDEHRGPFPAATVPQGSGFTDAAGSG